MLFYHNQVLWESIRDKFRKSKNQVLWDVVKVKVPRDRPEDPEGVEV
jgi:hypothetical protein